MKLWCLLLGMMLAAVPLRADNIYEIDAQGRKQVIQRDAIIIQNDSSYLAYKHFDLKERRVEKVSLAKGSLPFVVETSPPEVRAGIVANWKRFGYTVTVTDQAGKTTQVFDAYLDFFPPGGQGSFLESVPATTSLALLLANGGADQIKFDEIARIEFSGDILTVVRRDGRTEQGKFLMPTQQPAEARLLGITDRYNPSSDEVYNFSVPLARLKEIRFGR